MEKYEQLKQVIQDGRKKYGSKHPRFKHGLSYSPQYFIWQAMKRRCFNKNDKSYKNYGARGITICRQWLSFSNFYKDFGVTYKKGLSIERIDNNGNYEPNNCKWIPTPEQGKNRRTVKLFTYQGATHNVSEWERKLSLKPDFINSKLRKGLAFSHIIKLRPYARTRV